MPHIANPRRDYKEPPEPESYRRRHRPLHPIQLSLRGSLARQSIEETGVLVRLPKASLAGSELLDSAKGAASPVLAEFYEGQRS